MNTWFLCLSNTQHERTVETASADKSSLQWHRFHTRLWTLSIQWLWLKWGHLFYAVLPKLSVPSKRARDWHRKQWKLQSLSFCRIIPKKSPHWKTCWWASKLFWNLTLKHETVFFTMPKGKSCRVPMLSGLPGTLFIRKPKFYAAVIRACPTWSRTVKCCRIESDYFLKENHE